MVLAKVIEDALKKIDNLECFSQEPAASVTIQNHRKMLNFANSRKRTIKLNNCTDISSNNSSNARGGPQIFGRF